MKTPEEWAESVGVVMRDIGDARDPVRVVDGDATVANIAAAIREALAEAERRSPTVVPVWDDGRRAVRVTAYMIVTASTLNDLGVDVDRAVDKGWQPWQGPVIFGKWLAQAMVKTEAVS